MDNIAEDFRRIFSGEPYAVLVRDAKSNIVAFNKAARVMFRDLDNGKVPRKCYRIFHNLKGPPDQCYCGFASGSLTVTKVFIPWLNKTMEHVFVPVHDRGLLIGALDVMNEIIEARVYDSMQKETSPAVERVMAMPIGDRGGREYPSLVAALTTKEEEVLNHIMNGRSSSEISAQMSISDNTVNYHLKNVFSKLGVENRTQAAAIAYKMRLKQSEVMIREMNHRIKNSLTILKSLISLKMVSSESQQAKDALQWVDGQLQSFVSFHNLMLNTDGNAHVPVLIFFEEALGKLTSAYGIAERNIRIDHDIQSVSMHMNLALPCMQITNELVTNSIIHAFGGGDVGAGYSLASGKTETSSI